MSWDKDISYDLHALIDKGFPINDSFHEALKGDQAYSLELVVTFTSLGSPSNSYDDPGEGPEWEFEVESVEPELPGFLPLNIQQLNWLSDYFMSNDLQQTTEGLIQWLMDDYDDYRT